MKKLLLGLTVLGIIALGSSSANAMPPQSLERVTVTQVETIYNYMPVIPPGGHKPYSIVSIDVTSTGCTSADDFEINFAEYGRTKLMTIVRIRPDLCEVTPHTVNLMLRVDGGLDKHSVNIANPLLVEVQKVY